MRCGLLVLTCCSLLSIPVPSRTQEAQRKIVFVRITNLTFGAALQKLTRASGASFAVDRALENHPVSFSLTDVPLEDAPGAVRQQLEKQFPDLIVEKQGNGWLFKLREGAALPARRRTGQGSSGKVTVLFGGAPVRAIVKHLFADAPGVPKAGPYKVEVEKGVPDVPIDLQFTTNNEDLILSLVARQAGSQVLGIGFEQAGEHLTIGIRPDQRPRPGLFPRIIPPAQPKDRRIVCVFEKFPLMHAVQMVADRATLEEGPLLAVATSDEIPDEATVSFRLVTNDPEVLLQSFVAEARKQIQGLEFIRTADRITVTYRRP